VHEALGAEMGMIHALSLKTWTQEQYLAKKAAAEA
jgi:stress-induced morphogen